MAPTTRTPRPPTAARRPAPAHRQGRPAREDRQEGARSRPPATPSRPRRRAGEAPGRRGRWWRYRRLVFLAGFLILAVIAGGLFYVARLPLPKAPALAQTSFVYDDSGHLIASFNAGENRVDVSLRQVPQVLIDAVVSTEDRHFFTEGALNALSTLRAAFTDLTGGNLQGGSTITQQYVKNTYTGAQRTLVRKVKEAIIAEKVDQHLSKDQILQDYLNTIYFGRGAYGVEAASQAYFGKDVSQLGLPEASLLAGLIRNPDVNDPAHDLTAARDRQATVLAGMVRDRKITEAQALTVEATPMPTYVNMKPANDIGIIMNGAGADQYFIDYVRRQLIARYGTAKVYGGGLRVYTTLDPTLQQKAYDAVYNSPGALDPAHGDPAGALVSINDKGQVEALVGGQDYASSELDLALGKEGGGSGRQAGSTFKAFLLAQLVKEGYSVESQVPAPPEVVVSHGNSDGSPWVVRNFDGESPGQALSVVEATAQSINTVYAQLVEKIGPAALVQMAVACGISPSELKAYPSLTLGTADVSPLEMASGYSTFADGGVHWAPSFITKVTTAGGKSLGWPQPAARTVLTPHQAAVVDYTLQQVVLGGTGTAAAAAGVPVAGKTGTTDKSTDAWFIGYTPKLTTAVWMGYPQGAKPLVNFRGYSSIQGGTIPAQIFARYLRAAVQAQPRWGGQSFPPPGSLAGNYLYLTPANEPALAFPEGLGTTTTTTTVPPTTVAPTTTTRGSGSGSTTSTATTTVPHTSLTVPAGSSPTGSSPTGSSPTGSSPTGSSPTGSGSSTTTTARS